jgi:hypothetical protein
VTLDTVARDGDAVEHAADEAFFTDEVEAFLAPEAGGF